MMDNLLQDIRYGIRMLVRNPGFTAIAVLALALGIGANTAIFTVVNAVLLEPLPYQKPDEIMRLSATWANQDDMGILTISYPDFLDYRAQNEVFTDVSIIDGTSMTIAGGDEPERLQCALVSASLFPLLGVQPIVGRSFLPEEDQPSGGPVVIISRSLWQRRFNFDPAIVGQAITLSQNSYTVIGVMPSEFKMPSSLMGGRPTDLWMTITPSAHKRSRSTHRYEAYGRLKPGVTLARAQDDLSAIAGRLEQAYPDTNKGKQVRVSQLSEMVVGESRTMLLVLLGAVGFVLLIACANVANLLLARATKRQKEIAIRTAVGARRGRIVQQLMTESMLLALAGGAAGLLIALWSVDAFVALKPEGIPRLDEVALNAKVMGFTLGVSLVTGLLFGLVPALQVSKPNLVSYIKESGGSVSAGTGNRRIRDLLVVSEIALALVLLIGAGLLIKSFWRLQQVDSGIKTDNLLTLQLSLPQKEYTEDKQSRDFYRELLSRLEATPGVRSVGAVNILPLGGGFSCDSFARDDRPAPPNEEPCAEYRLITPDYFRTMGVPLMAGRGFTERDNEDSTQVVIINEAMAQKFWPGEDPIGMRLTPDTGKHVSREIVGVVRNVKHFGFAADAAPEFYIPFFQDYYARSMALALRTDSNPTSLIGAVRNEVWSLDKSLPVINVRTMNELVARSVAQPRFRTMLLGIFASVALMLAALGIYGVVSYSVTQRTREIGIRMALGAQTSDILKLILGHGVAVTMIGVAIGVAAASIVTRVLASFLFKVDVTDAGTFAGVSLLLMAVALLACYIPARRAMKVDPMVALRYE
jgi:putative ABC transport system permease protein